LANLFQCSRCTSSCVSFPRFFCLPSRHVGHTHFGTFEFANSIGWFFETVPPLTTHHVVSDHFLPAASYYARTPASARASRRWRQPAVPRLSIMRESLQRASSWPYCFLWYACDTYIAVRDATAVRVLAEPPATSTLTPNLTRTIV